MQVTAAVKTQVEAKLRKCHQMAELYYGRKFDFPTVAYTVSGSNGGWARGTKEINFNPILLMENIDDFIARTVPHELAHCLDYAVNPHNHNRAYGKRSVHGYDWKQVMMVIGVADPSRCHSYNVANARKGNRIRHEWHCDNCKAVMKLGPKRQTKMLAAGSKGCYRPSGKGCGWHHTYTYIGVEGSAPVSVKKATAPTPPKKAASHNRPKTKLTKKVRAEVIYQNAGTKCRQEIIDMFINVLDMTQAGGATYYANCKKKFG